MSSINQLSANTIVIMDLATELEDLNPDIAQGILVGGLLGMGLSVVDRNALGASLTALQLKRNQQAKEIGTSVMGLVAFSRDEQVAIAGYLRQAHIIDSEGNLIG